MKISLDFETRSRVDLKKTGAHIYAQDPTTDIWCACYSIDGGPVQSWVPGDPVPLEFADPDAEIHAWNAQFERVIWREVLTPRYDWPEVRLEQFHCTMAAAYAMGLPGSLDQCGQALDAKVTKDKEGHALMLRMCRPRKVHDDGTIVWWDDPEKVARLIAYCVRDVRSEQYIGSAIRALTKPERTIYLLDQRINDRGVSVDLALVNAGIDVATREKARLNREMRKTTQGFATCSQPSKIIEFCQSFDVPIESVAKDVLAETLDDEIALDILPPVVRHVLELRREFAKTSVAKLPTLLAGTSDDGRIRGLLQYCGASTGRWSGRRFQPQNLTRQSLKPKMIELLVPLVLAHDHRAIELMFGPVMAALSEIVRSCLIASKGRRLMSADYSNIEGRVVAWLAGEEWKLDAFCAYDAGTGPDLYKLAYAMSFGIPVDMVTGDLRQIGKVEELALGFGGGVGAFQTMAKNYGVRVSDDKAEEIKLGWRDAHPNIEQFWRDMEDAAFRAVQAPGREYGVGRVTWLRQGKWLMMRLPSGRVLFYRDPEIRPKKTPWGEMKDQVHYYGMNSYTRKWERCSAYGGLWTENAVQATARDIMAAAMVRMDRAGYNIVLTVHDEVVVDQPEDSGSLSEMVSIMQTSPKWAAGLPVAVAGWEGQRYRKG